VSALAFDQRASRRIDAGRRLAADDAWRSSFSAEERRS